MACKGASFIAKWLTYPQLNDDCRCRLIGHWRNVRLDFLNWKLLFSDIREEMQCDYDCAAWVALVNMDLCG